MMLEEEMVEVNGKVMLGVRRLSVSHVENACSFYAYIEREDTMKFDIKMVVARECEVLDRITDRPQVEALCGVEIEGAWYRGRVEQVGQGENKKLVRIRMLDFGWNCLVEVNNIVKLPAVLVELKVRCEKYKLDRLKPKGKADGFSVADRLRGKLWLENLIRGKVLVASCHRMVKYQGGIMVDCQVEDVNINKMVLREGFAVYKPGWERVGCCGDSRGVGVVGGYPGGIDVDYTSYFGENRRGLGGRRGKQSEGGRIVQKRKGKRGLSSLETLNSGDVDRILDELYKSVGEVRGVREEWFKGKRDFNNMLGVAEVIETAALITGPLMESIELIERLEAGEKTERELNEFLRAVDRYLKQYNEDVVEDQERRVKSKLEEIVFNIPDSWKLVAVSADKVTNENLVEVARNVKNWLNTAKHNFRGEEGIVQTDRELEILCHNMEMVAVSLRANLRLNQPKTSPTPVPHLATHMTALHLALQSELSITTASTSPSSPVNDSSILRSAWRSLTALSSQLDMARRKKNEFEIRKTSTSVVLC